MSRTRFPDLTRPSTSLLRAVCHLFRADAAGGSVPGDVATQSELALRSAHQPARMRPVDYYPQNSLYPAVETDRRQLSARGMLTLMRDHIWEIVVTTAVVLTLAVAYLLIATPIYSADVTVRVDPPEPNALGLALQNQEALPPPAPSPVTEMAVMESRSVLQPVIDQFRFDVSVTPHKIPILGDIAEKFATP